MEFATGSIGREHEIIDHFAAAFSASEGEEEGKRIGDLVRYMLSGTPEQDLFVFTAVETGAIVGAICFSRLTYDEDDRTVFILGPVAVATEYQRTGIGQRLLAYGLQALREAHVDMSVTYGNPSYYSKVGFWQITEAFARAPFKLNRPEGWLALSLTGAELTPLKGPSRCIEALNDPVFW